MLLASEKWPQQLLVAAKRFLIVTVCAVQFTGQHVGLEHGQPGSFSGQQGHRGGGVTDQHHPSARPVVHRDLAHPIEIEAISVVDRLHDSAAFPARVGEHFAQHRFDFVRSAWIGAADLILGEDEQKHGPVIAHREPAGHAPRNSIRDIRQLVAGPISVHLDCGNTVAEIVLEVGLWSKHQTAHRRMQATGADDEIEFARRTALQVHLHAVIVLLDRGDAVAEDGLHVISDDAVDHDGEITVSQAGELAGHPVESLGTESTHLAPAPVDQLHLSHAVSGGLQLRTESHPLSDPISSTPEVDDIAAGPQLRGLFNESGLMAATLQPVSQGRTGDAGAVDHDSHHVLSASNTIHEA